MKKITKLIIAIIVLSTKGIFGQATVGGNMFNLATDYLGWDGTPGSPPLLIKTTNANPINFATNDLLRANITTDLVNGIPKTRFGINNVGGTVIQPRSILHLGSNYLQAGNVGGWRRWMETGTFTDISNDFAFFGLVNRLGDTVTVGNNNDAVIVWGDNLNGADGADNLRFIFSGPFNAGNIGNGSLYNSAEVGRFAPNGRLGIGNFTPLANGNGSGFQPARHVEIYDEHLDPFLNNAAPQLRLTYTPNFFVNNGIWTDFQATVNGDLFIHPSANQTDRRVGVNIATPLAVLHVNGINVADGNSPGEVFRTDAPVGNTTNVTTNWRMYRWSVATTIIPSTNTLIGNLFNDYSVNNGKDFSIESSAGKMRFFTYANITNNVPIQRIIINDGNGSASGYVGIGNSFASPQSRLHIHQGGAGTNDDVWLQMTTDITTNAAPTDGLRLGVINATMEAQLKQQENAPLSFWTSNTQRATITALGNVGINTLTPNSYLEINTGIPVATGSSGLQFTDLTTASFLNNSFFTGVTKGVLSVDDNGKVVLVKDENGTPSNGITACTSPGINAVNFLTKISGSNQICKSGVYEDPTSNYVGIGNTFPQAKLHVQSTITNTAASYVGSFVDLDVTYNAGAGGNATDIGMLVKSNAHTADNNIGVRADVVGGVKDCRGFSANVDNPIGGFNYGFYSNLKDNANATNTSPSNIGFSSYNAANTLAGTSALNVGFSSALGIANQHSLGTMTGLHTVNRGGENSYGANLEVYNSTSATATCYGIKATTGPDYQCNNCVPAKNYASSFIANQGQEVYGVDVEANDGTTKTYGVRAITNSNNSAAADYYGVSGVVNVTYAVNKPKNSYGGNFVSYGATNQSFGVRAEALGGDNMNYAVFATVAGSACTSTSCINWAGYFNGSTYTSGQYVPSDSNLKRNIKSIPNSLSLIEQLNPKEFSYRKSIMNQLSLPEGQHYGFLAQDVQTVLPGLVKEARQPAIVDSAGNVIKHGFNFLAINYEEIIPLLVDVVQQQQKQIDSLINGMAVNNQPKMVNPNTIEVTLSNQSKIILNQNDPNPFAENTTINYFIPENVNAAQLLFYDNTGTILKSVDIKEKGQGSILIYGSNLSSEYIPIRF